MDRISRIADRVVAGGRSRSFYLAHPEGVNDLRVDKVEGTDIEVYTYEDDERRKRFHVLIYTGEDVTPWWHERFDGKRERQKAIDSALVNAKRRDVRKKRGHDLEVGDVVVFRPSATGVEFYQVTAVADEMVKVREIASKVERFFQGEEYVVPVPGSFGGPEIDRRANHHGVLMTYTGAAVAKRWDGNAQARG